MGPSTGQRWPKCPKHVLFVTSPAENLPPTPKIVFFDFYKKTCWIRRGFEQLSSSSSSLALAKLRATIVALVVVNG